MERITMKEQLYTSVETAYSMGIFEDLPESQGKVLSHIALNGERDAYGIYKDTGIKLTTTQAAIKKLAEKELIYKFREEYSTKGQKKVLYGLTGAGVMKALQCCYERDHTRHEDIMRIIKNYEDSGPLVFKYWNDLIREIPDMTPKLEEKLFCITVYCSSHFSEVDTSFFHELGRSLYWDPSIEKIINVILTIPDLRDAFRNTLNPIISYHQKQVETLSKYMA